jgi:AraC-like DNA-binding protein
MSKPDSFYRYLAVSERDTQWGLCVTGAGYRDSQPGALYPPKSHLHPTSHEYRWRNGRTFHEYAIIYISEGSGEFESRSIGGRAFGAGTALLLFPEVWHRYRPIKEIGWREYWVTFHGDHAERLQRNGFITPEFPVIDTGPDDKIIHSFNAILDHLRVQRIGFQHVIAAHTLEIIASVLSAGQDRRTDSHAYDLVHRLKAAIEEQTSSLPVIEDLAEALEVSTGHLRRVFKEHTGLSPYQYHLQLKLGRAKMMLRESELSIKEVATALGFQNVYHFSKLFKAKTDVSPNQWRQGKTTIRSRSGRPVSPRQVQESLPR